MTNLKTVTREDYATYIKTLEGYEDRPIETGSRSIMQTTLDGALVAQATYIGNGPGENVTVVYQIKR